MNSSSAYDSASSIYRPIQISFETSSSDSSSDSSSSSDSNSGKDNQSPECDDNQKEQLKSAAKENILNDFYSEPQMRNYRNIICSLAEESFSHSVLQNCLIAGLAISHKNDGNASADDQEEIEEDQEEDGASTSIKKKKRQDRLGRKRKRPHLNDAAHLGVWPLQETRSKLYSFASFLNDCKYHDEKEKRNNLKVAESTCKQLLLELQAKSRKLISRRSAKSSKKEFDADDEVHAYPITTRNLGCVDTDDLWEAAGRISLPSAAIQNAKKRFELLQLRNCKGAKTHN
jgi:hypothetical protein